MLCLNENVFLRSTFVPFCHQSLKKIDLLRKSFRIFGDQDVLSRCFDSFILPSFGVLLPHLVLCGQFLSHTFGKNLRACKFLNPNLTLSLQHQCSISSLCMLYKFFSGASVSFAFCASQPVLSQENHEIFYEF